MRAEEEPKQDDEEAAVAPGPHLEENKDNFWGDWARELL